MESQISNPFKVPPIKSYTAPVSPFNEDDITKLLNACRQTSKIPKSMKPYCSNRSTARWEKVIILTLLDSRIRVSELCGLLIKEYDKRLLVTGKGSKPRFECLGKALRQAIWS